MEAWAKLSDRTYIWNYITVAGVFEEGTTATSSTYVPARCRLVTGVCHVRRGAANIAYFKAPRRRGRLRGRADLRAARGRRPPMYVALAGTSCARRARAAWNASTKRAQFDGGEALIDEFVTGYYGGAAPQTAAGRARLVVRCSDLKAMEASVQATDYYMHESFRGDVRDDAACCDVRDSQSRPRVRRPIARAVDPIEPHAHAAHALVGAEEADDVAAGGRRGGADGCSIVAPVAFAIRPLAGSVLAPPSRCSMREPLPSRSARLEVDGGAMQSNIHPGAAASPHLRLRDSRRGRGPRLAAKRA